MKTWKLTVTEGELTALIHHHSRLMQNAIEDGKVVSAELSQRIHDLTKRLNRETPEIEGDPRPQEQTKQAASWG